MFLRKFPLHEAFAGDIACLPGILGWRRAPYIFSSGKQGGKGERSLEAVYKPIVTQRPAASTGATGKERPQKYVVAVASCVNHVGNFGKMTTIEAGGSRRNIQDNNGVFSP